jgi:uncharacterized protein
LPKTLEGTVVPLAFFYGGGVQLLAGMWEFCRGPAGTFGALAFSSYGGFWLSFAYFFSFILPGLQTSTTVANQAVGIFLTMWWCVDGVVCPSCITALLINFLLLFFSLTGSLPST